MALLYVQGHNVKSPLYEDATENIPEGLLATAEVGGGAALADAANHTRATGVVMHVGAGDHIAQHRYDYEPGIEDFVYKPAANKDSDAFMPNADDDVPMIGRSDGAEVKPPTVKETTNGVTSAPNIEEYDVVGFVDTSVADAPNAPGRIVQEGYTNDENDDGTSTTFNRSNGNFVAVGRALLADVDFPVTSFDERVWVERDASL